MSKLVGLLVGLEHTFPEPFVKLVNEKGKSEGVSAEMAVLGGTGELEERRYATCNTPSTGRPSSATRGCRPSSSRTPAAAGRTSTWCTRWRSCCARTT
jgi:hypothetical protein